MVTRMPASTGERRASNMVRFEKDKLVIEMEGTWPADRWVDVMRDLIRCISITDKERVDNNLDCIYGVCDLLEAMLPDEQDARKMIKG